MKIELTEEQYRRLVELVFLGNWIANSTETTDEEDLEYEEIEQLIFSFSREFSMQDLITYDEKFKKYFPTRQFEELVDPYIDNYDEVNFWGELSSRLAKRDLLREVGPVSKINDKHIERQFEIEEKYEIEFEKNGLKNLEIQNKKK